MKKRLSILICCCLFLQACGPTVTKKNMAVVPQKNKIADNKVIVVPKLDTKNIVFTTHVIYETTDDYFINCKYPIMQGLANYEIQNRINNNIKTKIANLIKNYQQDNQVISSEFSAFITNNILSIKFVISLDKPTWPPRNKPIYKIMTINYDLNSGKKIQLENLFKSKANYLQVISASALADLKEQLHNSSDLINITEADIKEITAPKIENYRNFLFNPKGITIIFANDKIAPNKANYPKVLILYGKIESMLAPSGPLVRT